MLLHSSCEEDPRGNQFDLQQKNKNVQSDSTSQLGKQLGEVIYETLAFLFNHAYIYLNGVTCGKEILVLLFI